MARQSLDAVRTNIYLSKPQDAALRTLSARSGITYAEHVRRAIDFYLAFSEDIHRKVDELAEASEG
jgi:hypothetical protein